MHLSIVGTSQIILIYIAVLAFIIHSSVKIFYQRLRPVLISSRADLIQERNKFFINNSSSNFIFNNLEEWNVLR